MWVIDRSEPGRPGPGFLRRSRAWSPERTGAGTARLTILRAPAHQTSNPRLLDLDHLDVEHQHRVGRDAAVALRAVAELRGDKEADLAALLDELQAFLPAGDHARELDGYGLAALGRIKDRAVDEGALVVDGHGA